MKIRGQLVLSHQERIEGLSIPEPNSGCWIWLGATRRNPAGMEYGSMCIGHRPTRRTVGAHRVSFEVYKGAIPHGLYVCHSCDNPLCVNPDHLFLGTAKDNAADRDRKGRLVAAPITRGEDHPSCTISDDILAILLSSPKTNRELSKITGVSDGYIRQLRRREYRKDDPAPPRDEVPHD